MRIAICEDDKVERDNLLSMIDEYSVGTLKLNVTQYESAEEFLFKNEGNVPFDCIILDIRMKSMSGMDLAKKIRESDGEVAILFTTGDKDCVYDGYKVGAARYILKPVKKEALYEALDMVVKLIDNNEKSKNDCYYMQYNGEYVKIPKKEIIRADIEGHYITITTKKKSYEYKSTLTSTMKELDDERYIVVNRSTLVNLQHVERLLRDECVMSDGSVAAISRNNIDVVHSKFVKYYSMHE